MAKKKKKILVLDSDHIKHMKQLIEASPWKAYFLCWIYSIRDQIVWWTMSSAEKKEAIFNGSDAFIDEDEL